MWLLILSSHYGNSHPVAYLAVQDGYMLPGILLMPTVGYKLIPILYEVQNWYAYGLTYMHMLYVNLGNIYTIIHENSVE